MPLARLPAKQLSVAMRRSAQTTTPQAVLPEQRFEQDYKAMVQQQQQQQQQRLKFPFTLSDQCTQLQ